MTTLAHQQQGCFFPVNRNSFWSKNLASQVFLFYAFFGSLWILFSDQILGQLTNTPTSLTAIQTLKGWLFILVTGILLYSLVKKGTYYLQQSEQRYRSLFWDHPQPMWVYDTKTLKFIAVNQAAIRHYGYYEAEFLLMKITDIFPSEDLTKFLEKLSSFQEVDRAGIWQHRKKDGTLITVDLTIHTIKWGGQVASVILAQDITEQLQVKRQLEQYAFLDGLTGLANQSLLLKHLQACLEQHSPSQHFAVLSLDLDRFKAIKYGFGHALAEQLLIAVARRLETCVSPEDTVARVGTDEFAILIDQLPNIQAAYEKAELIHEALAFPFRLEETTISFSTSIGIVISPLNSQKPEDYLRAADVAMHSAKRQGKGNTIFYEPKMQAIVAEHLQLEVDLRRAIYRHQLHLNYQPIISLLTKQVVGFEALVRWEHPQRGFISPMEFIPIAEETGLIVPLGRWVLSKACEDLLNWQKQLSDPWPITVAVNLSEVQLRHPCFLEEIEMMLRSLALTPYSLKLEITETSLMQNAPLSIKILERLKAKKISILIDDFGTGYSSLSYLQQLPVDALKIDRSFVTDVELGNKNFEIARTIITLAQSLGLSVIAEGIENAAQMEILKHLGCELGQGYFFSPPLTGTDVIPFLETWQQKIRP